MRDEQSSPRDETPPAVRQAELRAAYEANVSADKAPFDDVRIATPVELSWVIAMVLDAADLDDEYPEVNLSGALLNLSDFSGINVASNEAYGLEFSRANFAGSNLVGATLSYTSFVRASFSGANLLQAKLDSCDLQRASLYEANLQGTQLTSTDLRGASLPPHSSRAILRRQWQHLKPSSAFLSKSPSLQPSPNAFSHASKYPACF